MSPAFPISGPEKKLFIPPLSVGHAAVRSHFLRTEFAKQKKTGSVPDTAPRRNICSLHSPPRGTERTVAARERDLRGILVKGNTLRTAGVRTLSPPDEDEEDDMVVTVLTGPLLSNFVVVDVVSYSTSNSS